jgi:hypothetical protein
VTRFVPAHESAPGRDASTLPECNVCINMAGGWYVMLRSDGFKPAQGGSTGEVRAEYLIGDRPNAVR